METKTKIALAAGDGIGPEIMNATLEIMEKAGAKLDPLHIEIGEKRFNQGFSAGISPEDWEKIQEAKVLFKAPITTPQGKGYKSLNVTLRKTLGLFANIRPVKSYHPFIPTKHPGMDTIIFRENEEDLYAGIEHRQTQEVTQCLKLITRPGSEKIIRYAFEYAKRMNRKKVTCMIKDNIMKITDGIFHQIFKEVAKEYSEIKSESMIIDIGTARMADTPEDFDLVVLPNLYGDIVSDVVAQIAGSVGIAGSANVGLEYSMFEAIHGSAPDIAGKGIANPGGLLHAGVMMLDHLGQAEAATKIQNAWSKTIESGSLTKDLVRDGSLSLSTQEFKEEVMNNIGSEPSKLSKKEALKDLGQIKIELKQVTKQKKSLDGVDVFIDENDRNPNTLGDRLSQINDAGKLKLEMITNRGVKVYPNGNSATFCTDHWRCRFSSKGSKLNREDIIELQKQINELGFEIIKTENLYSFDNQPGYSLGQGQ